MQRPLGRKISDVGQAVPGVIDTLGDAFIRLVQRPFLILPPLLLDGVLWAGFRLPARPLTAAIEGELRGWGASGSQLAEQLGGATDGGNIVELLGLGVPSLVRGLRGDRIAGLQVHWIQGLGWGGTLLTGVGLLALGVVLAVFYLTLVGTLAREGSWGPRALLQGTWANMVRSVGVVLVTLGLALLLLLPVLLVTAALLILGINIVPLAALAVMTAFVFGYLMLYFAENAIVVSNAGPLLAIRLSYQVVRRNFWSTIRFISITTVIGAGMPLAFSAFARSPYSMPFALVGHAFIATGLVAASMLFYRDRARILAGDSADSALPASSRLA